MINRSGILESLIVVLSIFLAMYMCPQVVFATSVDQLSLCNLTGNPGDVIQTNITLQGNEAGERSGLWYTHYKKVDGDSQRMDITSWIEVSPADYVIRENEIITFSVSVTIPKDAEAGLWGATSENAGEPGHSLERRMYIIFKDTQTGGNVYSGLLIPVSVVVTESPSFVDVAISVIKSNLLVTFLLVVIVILVVSVALLSRKRQRGKLC